MPHRKLPYFRGIALTLLLAGFSITGFVAWKAEQVAKNTERQRFSSSVKRLDNEISQRMKQFDYGLRGAASIWPASTKVTRADFSAMILDRDLEHEFPGSLGLGFVRRVPRDQVDGYLTRVRADDAPDFNIKTSGNHDELYVIEYLVPPSSSQVAIGFDIGQETSRRIAAERAMLSGHSAVSAPITLIEAPEEGTGFLVLFPVYEKGTRPNTEAERKQHLLGWIYMPILAKRILQDSSTHIDGSLNFAVYHGTKIASENLLFDESQENAFIKESNFDPLFTESRIIELGGATWTVICSTGENFKRANRISVVSTMISGGIISILIAVLISTLGRSHQRAQKLAKQMTLELEEAVKKLKMLSLVATRTTNAVIFCDTKRMITWVNQGFTRMTGYTFEEAIGKSLSELLQSEHTSQETVLLMRQRFDQGKPVHCEIVNHTKSGMDYWAELDVVPLKNHLEALTGFMIIQQDISERKHNEASLREQAERTAMALANGELGLWDWDITTGNMLFDTRWASMLGEKLENLKPNVEEWIERCHPEDLSSAKTALKKHLKGKTEIYESRQRLKHRDGSWRWIISSGKVVSWNINGKATRMVGTHRDVTDQYNAQLESQRQQAALNHTGNLAKVGAWELTIPDFKLYWSDQVRLIHEVEKDYVPDLESAFSFYQEEAHVTIRNLTQKAIELGENFDIELPLVTAKGKNIWVRVMGEVYRENSIPVAIHGAFQDVTDDHLQHNALDKARKIAEKASQAKAEFLANMSHEIRTPMNAVIGISELLQQTRLNSKQEDYVHMIRSSGETLLALINDILDFSKIDSGNLELERIPIHLRDCVEYAMEFAARPAAKKQLELMLWIDPDVPDAIYGDKTRLCQVLINLISNAVKFTDDGEILISISNTTSKNEGSDQILLFSVKDTGIGIPQARQDRLFKSFSQVDASTTRNYGGTGLGLAICSRLIRLMGGKIWVDSTPDEGSTFYFEIPFMVASCPAEIKTINPVSDIKGKRLLIVDDNQTNLRILSDQMKDWDIVTFATTSAEELLSWIACGGAFDLAIIDVQMQEMDGYELAAEIRKLKNSDELPIIAITSLGDDGKKFEGLDIYKIFSKPVKSLLLYEAMVRALGALHTQEPDHGDTQQKPTLASDLAENHPLNILLAEDMPINQRVIQLMLGYLGYTVTIAANGRKVLEALEHDTFDIILMDVQMPEMDGLTCTRLICEKYPVAQRPWIMALTANALEGDSQTCLSAGMDDYITKPVSREAISSAIIRASEALVERRLLIESNEKFA